MSSIPTQDIKKALCDKGFVLRDTHHHRYLFFWKGRKTTVHTKISHSLTEYGDNLLSEMARQLKLKRKQFVEGFIRCPLTKEAYTEILIKEGHIKLSPE